MLKLKNLKKVLTEHEIKDRAEERGERDRERKRGKGRRRETGEWSLIRLNSGGTFWRPT